MSLSQASVGRFVLVNIAVMVILLASGLLAFAVRRNAVICLAVLAFLPAIPAAVRYLLADPGIVSPDGDESVRYLLLGAINYGGVWGGFAAGLMFDLLNARPEAKASTAEQDEGNAEAVLDDDGRTDADRGAETHDAA